jgi:hypothetical protein
MSDRQERLTPAEVDAILHSLRTLELTDDEGGPFHDDVLRLAARDAESAARQATAALQDHDVAVRVAAAYLLGGAPKWLSPACWTRSWKPC